MVGTDHCTLGFPMLESLEVGIDSPSVGSCMEVPVAVTTWTSGQSASSAWEA